MKRIVGALPHVLMAAYVTSLSAPGFLSPGPRVACLAVALLLGSVLYRGREAYGLSPVSRAYLLYVGLNLVGFWLMPGSLAPVLSANPSAFLYGCLCAVALASLVPGRSYFTEYFARRKTSPAVWQTGMFKKINRNMTRAWAGIFGACVLMALSPSFLSLQRTPGVRLTGQVALPLLLMLAVGVPFNRRYPAYYQRKLGIEPARPSRGGEDGTNAEPVSAAAHRFGREEGMSHPLKVVAVNGSPHAGIGNTSLMIQMLTPVLAQEGIELEEVFLAEKRIEYCVGCGVCIEKGKCWRRDDHAEIVGKLLAADGVILGSPVYFKTVTGQMKTFLDRSLSFGHQPRATWKPGLTISVSAGMAETATAQYLADLLRVYGAFPVGTLTAIAVGPGGFMGQELVEARAKDLALDLARAIKEKRRYPATDRDLSFYLFIRDLVQREKKFMRADYSHWESSGIFKGFEEYVSQSVAAPPVNPSLRKEWIRDMISREMTKAVAKESAPRPGGVQSVATCEELLRSMPSGFQPAEARGLSAVYQFEISGAENFVGHLRIAGDRCSYADGAHEKPDIVIKAPADVWLAIARGALDGQSAFMTGEYTVEGDLGLLLKLRTLFRA